jgi:anti-sigma-K factor RskA
MNYSEDHIALAAEYALGTLDAEERALVETMMTVDHGFMDLVDAWAVKFAPLHAMVGEVEPPAHVWNNIKAAVGSIGAQAPIDLAETGTWDAAPEVIRERERGYRDVFAPIPPRGSSESHLFRNREEMRSPVILPPNNGDSNVVALSSRRGSGRVFGVVMTAIAASLAGIITLQAYRPDLLPGPLRIKPAIQFVEVKVPAAKSAPAQMVALLQQDGASPAFIMTVDTGTKNFTVRKVGAAAESGKSYELWLVSDKLQKPRSLGLIGNSDFTIRPTLASYDTDTINKATYAVTLEPEGGSTTGGPTGPVVYKGNLIESVPAGADQIAPR